MTGHDEDAPLVPNLKRSRVIGNVLPIQACRCLRFMVYDYDLRPPVFLSINLEQKSTICMVGGVLPVQDFEDSGSDEVGCCPSNKDKISKFQICIVSLSCSIEISWSPFSPF